MDLAIIILNFNTNKLLKDCLYSIFSKHWATDFKVYVIDNGSIDDSVNMVKNEFPQVELIQSNTNLGFSKGCNLALRKVKANYYLLLNSDTKVKNNSIDNMLNFMKGNNFQIASCKLFNGDGSLQPNVGDLPFGWPLIFWISGLGGLLGDLVSLPSFHQNNSSYYNKEKEVGWVTGAAMMISKEVVDKVGFLDEKIFMYTEDVEYCIRAKEAKFKVGYTPKAEIVHLGGASLENPKYNQWLGEFSGLLYIYGKYKNVFNAFYIRVTIYIFIIIRIIVFVLIGKMEHSKVYSKILMKI